MRFSPACAGNSRSGERRGDVLSVQPRVRGELLSRSSSLLLFSGSAPRARGTPRAIATTTGASRFSPACAGNSTRPRSRRTSPSVQPRVRGELVEGSSVPWIFEGSAPRARGTLPSSPSPSLAPRFSPACAGNSTCPLRPPNGLSVQPRVRGELPNTPSPHHRSLGSAPRARGTPVQVAGVVSEERFSPACAGNSLMRLSRHRSAAVQPRVRGELHVRADAPRPRLGSAPRARGTRPGLACPASPCRFSPACAGNSKYSTGAHFCQPVQPRVRGELTQAAGNLTCDSGSAPRARGTPRPLRRRR